jgi:hypothetical protein
MHGLRILACKVAVLRLNCQLWLSDPRPLTFDL